MEVVVPDVKVEVLPVFIEMLRGSADMLKFPVNLVQFQVEGKEPVVCVVLNGCNNSWMGYPTQARLDPIMGHPLSTNTDQLTLPLGTAIDDWWGLDVDDSPDPRAAPFRPVTRHPVLKKRSGCLPGGPSQWF
jgi:hypothetical protein